MRAALLRRPWVFYAASAAVFLSMGLAQFPETLAGRLVWDERVAEYIPWRVEAARLIRDGEIPLFTERVFGGMPVLSIGYTGVLYPPNWLYVPFGPLVANWLAVLHTVVGGLGMLAYLRGRRLCRFASFCGAVFFAAGTFGLMHTSHVAMREAAMIGPWVAWAAWRIRRCPKLSRATCLAAILALQVASGYPQITLFTLFWLFFDWISAASPTKLFAKRTLVSAGGGIVAAMLVAPLVLSASGILDNTVRPNVTVEQWIMSGFAPGYSLLFLNPEAYGLPLKDWTGEGYAGEIVITINLAAWSLCAIALPAWLLRRRKSPRVRRMAALLAGIVVAWMFALGSHLPGYEALFEVPPFGLFRIPARWLWLSTTLACVGAASGIHALAGVSIPRRTALATGGVVLFGAIVSAVVLAFGGEADTFDRLLAGAAATHFTVAAVCLVCVCARRGAMLPAAAIVAIACTVQYRTLAPNVSIASMDPLELYGDPPPTLAAAPPSDVVRHFTFRMREAPHRAETMPHSTALFRGYRSLDGYCPLVHREMGHYPKISGDGGIWLRDEFFAEPSVLEAFAVSHVSFDLGTFTPEQRDSLHRRDGTDWRILAETQDFAIVELLRTAPRFHLAAQWHATDEPRPILDNWWQREPARAERTILVDPALAEGFPPQDQPLGRGTVKPLALGGSAQTFEVEADAPGVLVVRDAWWPGWRYRLVGDSGVTDWREVAKAEGMLRAVAIDRGHQIVEMEYEPPGWRKGLLLSLAGSFLAVMFVVADRRKRATSP